MSVKTNNPHFIFDSNFAGNLEKMAESCIAFLHSQSTGLAQKKPCKLYFMCHNTFLKRMMHHIQFCSFQTRFQSDYTSDLMPNFTIKQNQQSHLMQNTAKDLHYKVLPQCYNSLTSF